MKVFINVRCGSYSGGMILVAANTKEEAIKAFREDKDYDWMWYEIDDKIDDMYYGENGWMGAHFAVRCCFGVSLCRLRRVHRCRSL